MTKTIKFNFTANIGEGCYDQEKEENVHAHGELVLDSIANEGRLIDSKDLEMLEIWSLAVA